MTSEPRVIGLLGGMSWPSTITYYTALNRGAQHALGGSHSARILLWSGDYAQVEQAQLDQRWDDAGDLLAAGARRLEAAGADLLAIACNTMHRVGDAVRSTTRLPLVDIIEVTTAHARTAQTRRAGILATAFTIQSRLYADALERADIATIIPAGPDLELLDRIIYDELCLGRLSEPSRRKLSAVADHLVDAGADTVILACTELGEAMASWHAADVQLIDTTQSHVAALLAASLRPSAPA